MRNVQTDHGSIHWLRAGGRPMSTTDLMRQSSATASTRDSEPGDRPVINESARGRGTVLVVEDDKVNSAALVLLLKAQGYHVQAAADGETALATIAQDPPDLILLDVRLPGMNGFDVCRSIKQQSATRLIPVILVTGLDAR